MVTMMSLMMVESIREEMKMPRINSRTSLQARRGVLQFLEDDEKLSA
jgi:hypothetical protein